MSEEPRPIDQLGSEDCRHVRETGEPIVVTDGGKPAGVLLSTESYEQLLDRARFTERMAAIRRSRDDIEAGRVRDARQSILALADKHGVDRLR